MNSIELQTDFANNNSQIKNTRQFMRNIYIRAKGLQGKLVIIPVLVVVQSPKSENMIENQFKKRVRSRWDCRKEMNTK